MSIWFNPAIKIDDIARLGENTMGDFLGMQFTEIGADFLTQILQPTAKSAQRADETKFVGVKP